MMNIVTLFAMLLVLAHAQRRSPGSRVISSADRFARRVVSAPARYANRAARRATAWHFEQRQRRQQRMPTLRQARRDRSWTLLSRAQVRRRIL